MLLVNKNKSFLSFYSLGLFVLLVIVYGLIPGKNLWSLGTSYTMLANTQALVNQGLFDWSYLTNMGYPAGFPILSGLPFVYISSSLSILFHVDSYTANIFTGILFLLVSFISLALLLRSLETGWYISVTFSALFLVQHFVYGQAGYHYMLYGFILLPCYIFVDILFFKNMLNNSVSSSCLAWKSIFFWLFLLSIIKSFSLFMDGYSFVISSLYSFALAVVYFVRKRRFDDVVVSYLGVVITSCGVAVLLYKLYVTGGAGFHLMPPDFFRAQGIDVVSFFQPGKDLFFFNFAGIGRAWNGLSFYGDGCNVKYSYLGYGLLFLFFGALFKVKKSPVVIALIVSGFIALLLSLGPSLKLNNQKDVGTKTEFTFEDYLMPKSAATLNLNTDIIYQKVPGLNNMRVVSRWVLLFKLTLVVCSALFVAYLKKQGLGKMAIFLTVLAFCELFPNLGHRYALHSYFFNSLEKFDQSVVDPLGKYIGDNDKIAFLSSNNDFLANYISASHNAMSYNCGIDKNLEIAKQKWPDSIGKIISGNNLNVNLYDAMKKGIVGAFIIPYFNLRWHSYYWPPDEKQLEYLKVERISKIDLTDNKFKFQEEKWFMVVTLNDE